MVISPGALSLAGADDVSVFRLFLTALATLFMSSFVTDFSNIRERAESRLLNEQGEAELKRQQDELKRQSGQQSSSFKQLCFKEVFSTLRVALRYMLILVIVKTVLKGPDRDEESRVSGPRSERQNTAVNYEPRRSAIPKLPRKASDAGLHRAVRMKSRSHSC